MKDRSHHSFHFKTLKNDQRYWLCTNVINTSAKKKIFHRELEAVINQGNRRRETRPTESFSLDFFVGNGAREIQIVDLLLRLGLGLLRVLRRIDAAGRGRRQWQIGGVAEGGSHLREASRIRKWEYERKKKKQSRSFFVLLSLSIYINVWRV